MSQLRFILLSDAGIHKAHVHLFLKILMPDDTDAFSSIISKLKLVGFSTFLHRLQFSNANEAITLKFDGNKSFFNVSSFK